MKGYDFYKIIKAKNAKQLATKYGDRLLVECNNGTQLWLNPKQAYIAGEDQKLNTIVKIKASYCDFLEKQGKDLSQAK